MNLDGRNDKAVELKMRKCELENEVEETVQR